MANSLRYPSMESEITRRSTTTIEPSSAPGTGISIVVLYQDIVGHLRMTLNMMQALGRHRLPNHRTGHIPETSIHNLLVATGCSKGAWFRMTRQHRLATTLDTIARPRNIERGAMIEAIRICRHHRRSGSAIATQATTVIENGSDLERGASRPVDASANIRVRRVDIGVAHALAHRHGLARGRDHGLLPPIAPLTAALTRWMTSNMNCLGCSDPRHLRSESCTSHQSRSHGQRLTALSGKQIFT